jgi:hypothetical protein
LRIDPRRAEKSAADICGHIMHRGFALALFGGVLIWAVAALAWVGWQPLHHTLMAWMTAE